VIVRGAALHSPAPFSILAGAASTVQLRIIETTDLHLHLLPYDYYADRPEPGVGLTSAAALIDEARAEVPNALLFDNGDFLQGTPVGDFFAYERGLHEGDLHPVMAAMNALDFDAITLGNHEFNYGLDFLQKTLAGAQFPVVSANLSTRLGAIPRTDHTLARPYALLDRLVRDGAGHYHPIRIGVIGFAPPQIVDWDRHRLGQSIVSRDIVETARDWVPEMREAGADLIIALAHTGIGEVGHSDGMENAALPLARIDGIDALLTGHTHLVFPSPAFAHLPDVDIQAGTLAGKPAVMAGFWGSHIGLIDLLLTRESGEWRVLGTRSEARPIQRKLRAADDLYDRGAAGIVNSIVAAAHDDTLAAIRRPVGHCPVPLHSYFVHLGGTDALSLVAEAQRAFIADQLTDPDLRALPLLSAVAPYKAGGRSGPGNFTDIPAGPLALRNIADLYLFPNAIAAVQVTGAEILDWLERSASAFNQVQPGDYDTVLLNAAMPGYNFEIIDDIDVTYDLTQPARYSAAGVVIHDQARRVSSATLNGAPIDPEARFILCTNSYRAHGAGDFPGMRPERIVFDGEQITRDILRAYIGRLGSVQPRPRGAMRFKPIPDASVIFETGPGARRHIHQIKAFRPEPRGLSRDGFLRLRLSLENPELTGA
jgi:2',3'-cyclic-nucleotide 2'-phosphodiesterase/3'-nucleotidase